jgi:Fructose-1-phosphate kinase and related fructose-6-phosphate kinase (PfkB)
MIAPTFYTLTGNLLAERTFEFSTWQPDRTQRAQAESFQVGGKGINVSRMLTRLQIPNTALCFAGGETGDECRRWLRERGLRHEMFATSRPTRTGLVVRAPGIEETTFLGPDTPPDAAACEACAQFLDTCDASTVLAFCGSFPGWENDAARPLREALTRLIARATVCVDTYGPPLRALVEQPVSLVKINRQEFAQLWGPEFPPTLEDALAAAVRRWPVRAWVITDGPNPVGIASPTRPPTLLTPPPIKEISATGSGDVLFACILHFLYGQGLTLFEAVSFALPFASANAADPGIAEFNLNQLPHKRSFPL